MITKEQISEILSVAINNINQGISKKITIRKSDETPPQDTRHLTDTRARVSTLLEYSLTYEVNRIFNERESQNSLSTVLWNVFPDLIVRNGNMENIAGLEVKALDLAAEEKSANLHTPISYIRKGKDFLVILSWGWVREVTDNYDIYYPHVYDVGIFDAWLIAKIRDTTWLINRKSKGKLYCKGFDINTPIINGCTKLEPFKAEEGNLGKVMRIKLSEKADLNLSYYEEMIKESADYYRFSNLVLGRGIVETAREIADYLGIEVECEEVSIEFTGDAKIIAKGKRDSNRIIFVSGKNKLKQLQKNCRESDVVISFNYELNWEISKFDGNWKSIAKGEKPSIELGKIASNL
ncbi:hypothetical protein WB896_004265 [Vibrio vulnificus]